MPGRPNASSTRCMYPWFKLGSAALKPNSKIPPRDVSRVARWARASTSAIFEAMLRPGRNPCCTSEIQDSKIGSQQCLKELAISVLSVLTSRRGRVSAAV